MGYVSGNLILRTNAVAMVSFCQAKGYKTIEPEGEFVREQKKKAVCFKKKKTKGLCENLQEERGEEYVQVRREEKRKTHRVGESQ